MRQDAATLRERVASQDLLLSRRLIKILDAGDFQLECSRDGEQTCRHFRAIYETRYAIALKKGATGDIVPQTRELCDHLQAAPDSRCALWIVDTGDLEFIAFEIIDHGRIAGILAFDRNQLPGTRLCQNCERTFYGRPPDYECHECGGGSVPDTWKYRPRNRG